jgi:transposase-like protein
MAYIDGPSLAWKITAAGVIRHGFYRTKGGKRRRYRCRKCGQTFCANI